MNEVNKTLYIPLYGKSKVSLQGIILNDPSAERIWKEEAFPIRCKSRSKWLAYNMAMRARVFDDWTASILQRNRDALVLHIGCGLDSRYKSKKSLFCVGGLRSSRCYSYSQEVFSGKWIVPYDSFGCVPA